MASTMIHFRGLHEFVKVFLQGLIAPKRMGDRVFTQYVFTSLRRDATSKWAMICSSNILGLTMQKEWNLQART